jgi:TPP-dependent pyruvate/acetoin dehydrogenase alpha subunit
MKYVPAEQLQEWAAKDPITRYERHLTGTGVASQGELDGISAALEISLNADVDAALASPFPAPETALPNVYGDREVAPPVPPLVEEWERRKGGA